MSSISRAAVQAALLTVLAGPALAHATLETKEAETGSYYKAVVRIGHGCEGSPTLKVRVRLPDGVTSVKPQPKSGWELATVKGKLATPITDSHGNPVTEGITEVDWSGRLLDEHYDEFVVRVKLPDRPGETLHFPIVQECEQGAHRWIEIPKPGQDADDLKEPAPAVKLLPKR
jgi:uncharacterized protein YcnI